MSSIYFQTFCTVSTTLPLSRRICLLYTVTLHMLSRTVRCRHSERICIQLWETRWRDAHEPW